MSESANFFAAVSDGFGSSVRESGGAVQATLRQLCVAAGAGGRVGD